MKKYIKIIIFIVITMIVLFGIIQINNKKKESFVKLIINEQEILISKNTDENIINLETLNSEKETNIKVELKNAQVKINQEKIKNGEEHSLGKIDISKENKIKLNIKFSGEFKYTEFIINTLPDEFPEYEFNGKSEEQGEYYVTTYSLNINKKHYIYKLNEVGNVTFYKETQEVCYNFKKNIIDEKVRYTYLENMGFKTEGTTLSLPMKLIVLDENYKKINEIYYYNNEEDVTDEEKKLDNHDYIYLSDNHYILIGFVKEIVLDFPNYEGIPTEIWNCKIQEILDGEIIWEFETAKNKELYKGIDENNMKDMLYEPCIDYIHFNSIKIDPVDKNFICSFRNIDAIVKIDRQTGKILWILGGKADQFGLTDEQKFSRQHSISFLSDNSILLYDNGYSEKKTRVVTIKINEQNKTIEKFKDYELNICSYAMGAVQSVNEEKNIYLVTYGVGNFEYGFEEVNLETLEPIVSFKIESNNNLYCVNKYK